MAAPRLPPSVHRLEIIGAIVVGGIMGNWLLREPIQRASIRLQARKAAEAERAATVAGDGGGTTSGASEDASQAPRIVAQSMPGGTPGREGPEDPARQRH